MKKILIVLTVLALIVLAVGLTLDGIVASAIESGASGALGISTSVGSADLSLFSGGLQISALEVNNPPGFESEHIFEVGNTEIDVSLGTVFDDTIIAPRLLVEDVVINVEQKRGKMNYSTLRDNLRKRKAGSGSRSTSGKRFVIEEVLIRNIVTNLNFPPLQTSVTVPEIRIKDVGKGSEGAAQDELAEKIFEEIFKAVSKQGGGIPPNIAAHLRGGLSDEKMKDVFRGLGLLEETGNKGVDDATDKVKDLLEKLGKQ